jgi:hypothetical protein
MDYLYLFSMIPKNCEFCFLRVGTVFFWKQPLAEMQGKAAYIRLKVVGPLLGPCASGSYVHRAVLFFKESVLFFISKGYMSLPVGPHYTSFVGMRMHEDYLLCW